MRQHLTGAFVTIIAILSLAASPLADPVLELVGGSWHLLPDSTEPVVVGPASSQVSLLGTSFVATATSWTLGEGQTGGVAHTFWLQGTQATSLPGVRPTCDAAHKWQMIALDDTDDNLYANICICSGIDGGAYSWRILGSVATSCPIGS